MLNPQQGQFAQNQIIKFDQNELDRVVRNKRAEYENNEEDDENAKQSSGHKNVSKRFLSNKMNSLDDPLKTFGIMTLNNVIPYRKPILKSSIAFVNARGVI